MLRFFEPIRDAILAVGQSLSDFEALYRDAVAASDSQIELRWRLSRLYTPGPWPRRMDRELLAVLRALAAWHSLDPGRVTPMPKGNARVRQRRSWPDGPKGMLKKPGASHER